MNPVRFSGSSWIDSDIATYRGTTLHRAIQDGFEAQAHRIRHELPDSVEINYGMVHKRSEPRIEIAMKPKGSSRHIYISVRRARAQGHWFKLESVADHIRRAVDIAAQKADEVQAQ